MILSPDDVTAIALLAAVCLAIAADHVHRIVRGRR